MIDEDEQRGTVLVEFGNWRGFKMVGVKGCCQESKVRDGALKVDEPLLVMV